MSSATGISATQRNSYVFLRYTSSVFWRYSRLFSTLLLCLAPSTFPQPLPTSHRQWSLFFCSKWVCTQFLQGKVSKFCFLLDDLNSHGGCCFYRYEWGCLNRRITVWNLNYENPLDFRKGEPEMLSQWHANNRSWRKRHKWGSLLAPSKVV